MADSRPPEQRPEPGILVPLLIVLVLGAGAGFGYGTTLGAPPPASAARTSGQVGDADGPKRATSAGESSPMGKADVERLKEHVVPLEPMIVNMGSAAGRWLRLEGSVAFAQPIKEGREALVAQLNEDLMGYLRSASLAQVESASSLEFLRDDLTEIVQLRTKGRAKRFVLRTLVIE